MLEPFRGVAAKFYAFAAKNIFLLRELQGTVADEVTKKVASGTILDVGTGPGYLPIEIAARNRYLQIVGLDVSRDMIKIAHTNSSRARAENVQFLVSDVSISCVQNESVDLAVATLSFHHWSSPTKAFEELSRVTKRSGEVWIRSARALLRAGLQVERAGLQRSSSPCSSDHVVTSRG
jgi:ubiquinone/menaquinone biosynthesis C-methylase UbiE